MTNSSKHSRLPRGSAWFRAGRLLIWLCLASICGTASAQGPLNLTPQAGPPSQLTVPLNKSQVLRVQQPVSQLVVGNPKIADVAALTDRAVYVLGKEVGSTNLAIYGRDRQLLAVVDLVVTYDVEGLKSQLDQILPKERIEVRPIGTAIALTGTVSSAAQAARAAAVAERFAPEKVTNLLRVSGTQQVMLSVRVAEMQRSVARDLGLKTLNFAAGVGSNISVVEAAVPSPSLLGFAQGGNPSALLKAGVGIFQGRFALNLLFDALEEKGLIKTLAEPNLVALSGDTANFLAGGEFPIPVAQNSDDNGRTITIEFKQFGVSLAFTPTVLDDGLINLLVNPEVSQINPNNSIVLDGLRIPGLATRRAKTTIELRDGQSFAIAGLLQSDAQDLVRQIPGLGEVPVLGALFRSTEFQARETELVIIVTPRLVQPVPAGTLAAPTDGFVPPTQAEMTFLGRTEGAAGSAASGTTSPSTASLGAQPGGGIAGPYGHILK